MYLPKTEILTRSRLEIMRSMMTITLQEVTPSNWRAIVALHVAPEQEDWVAPNHYSLLEAAYGFEGELAHLKLVPLAIYAADTPVGFLLYNAGPTLDRFFIMRLMIDHLHQGNGYGRAALSQLLELFRAYPQATEVAVSYNQGNTPARQLYLSCGFVEVGLDDTGGTVMWQALNPHHAGWTSLWNPAIGADSATSPGE
jgi:diamine N-acetyltransferase